MVLPARYGHKPSTGLGSTSLYSILPSPPRSTPASLHAGTGQSRADPLAKAFESNRGGTLEIYETLIDESIRSIEKERYDKKYEEVRSARKDESDENVKENVENVESLGSPSSRKGKGRAMDQDNLSAEEEEDHEDADNLEKKRKPGNEIKMKRPNIEIPDLEVPLNYPSGPLLSSIHNHTSHLLAAKHLLLPDLTPDFPYLPSEIIHHINSLKLELENIEVAKAVDLSAGSSFRYKDWKKRVRGKRRTEKVKEEGEEKVLHKAYIKAKGWRDVEKRWEGSALVAVGMFVQLLTSHLLKDPQAHPNYAVTAEEETLRTELVKTMEVDELKFFEDKIAEIEKERVKRERGVPGSIAAMRTRRAELKEQGTPKKKRKLNKQQSASLEESNRRLGSFEHEDSVVLEDIDPPIDSDQISSQADQDEKMSGVEEESESDEEVQDEGDVSEVEVSAGDESLEESVITADGEEEEDDSSDDSFGYVSN